MARVMTVASGKGGVGKSCVSANLGAALARSGLRVLLVDGDFGLANLDILLGVQPAATLEQVLKGEARIQDAIVGVEPNLWLLPAGSGLLDYRDAPTEVKGRLMSLFERFPWEMDLVLLDAGAGIQENVLSLHNPVFESTVVLTPEPTSLTDAYGLVKLLRREIGVTRVSVIVNQVTDAREGRQVFQNLKEVAARFIDVEFDFLGHIQKDEKITQAVMKRKILLDLDPGAPSAQCLELIAKRVRLKRGDESLEANSLPAARMAIQRRVADVGFGLVERPLTSGRFQDEPARGAPGNTAGFWRTLFGEVKA
jgi:flagellar biosynthesis protein FlhG